MEKVEVWLASNYGNIVCLGHFGGVDISLKNTGYLILQENTHKNLASKNMCTFS